jgi:hypothetical protein
MKRVLVLALVLAGCIPAGTTFGFLTRKAPSQFSPQELAYFNGMPNLGAFGYCDIIAKQYASYSKADMAIVRAELTRRGFTKRDADLILEGNYGTGQTFKGMTCSLGYSPQVNTAFYPGVGHRWQAVTAGRSYIYLEGNGTPEGMRVTAWN